MVSIIAAVAKNGVIGSEGKIPWDIPEDKAYFKKITSGGIVIMGRRTFEEIGFPLPKRHNIVVSRKKTFSGKNICTAENLEKALETAHIYAQKTGIDRIFLCGGEKIYTQGIEYAQRMYITEIDENYQGDTFFPKFSTDKFRLSERTYINGGKICFCIYECIKNK